MFGRPVEPEGSRQVDIVGPENDNLAGSRGGHELELHHRSHELRQWGRTAPKCCFGTGSTGCVP